MPFLFNNTDRSGAFEFSNNAGILERSRGPGLIGDHGMARGQYDSVSFLKAATHSELLASGNPDFLRVYESCIGFKHEVQSKSDFIAELKLEIKDLQQQVRDLQQEVSRASARENDEPNTAALDNSKPFLPLPPPVPTLERTHVHKSVPFWTYAQWKEFKRNESILTGEDPDYKRCMTDVNGKPLSSSRLGEIYEESKIIWNTLYRYREDPRTWHKKHSFPGEYYANAIMAKVPEFLLADGPWKVHVFATARYSDWCKPRKAGRLRHLRLYPSIVAEPAEESLKRPAEDDDIDPRPAKAARVKAKSTATLSEPPPEQRIGGEDTELEREDRTNGQSDHENSNRDTARPLGDTASRCPTPTPEQMIPPSPRRSSTPIVPPRDSEPDVAPAVSESSTKSGRHRKRKSSAPKNKKTSNLPAPNGSSSAAAVTSSHNTAATSHDAVSTSDGDTTATSFQDGAKASSSHDNARSSSSQDGAAASSLHDDAAATTSHNNGDTSSADDAAATPSSAAATISLGTGGPAATSLPATKSGRVKRLKKDANPLAAVTIPQPTIVVPAQAPIAASSTIKPGKAIVPSDKLTVRNLFMIDYAKENPTHSLDDFKAAWSRLSTDKEKTNQYDQRIKAAKRAGKTTVTALDSMAECDFA